mmetsp:Transcript_6635/g.8817  ORF Transcript_6635/g.8817 Transcript_6635/m.8817 type:complete len:109 (+) Transcript_6635:243-569(+)
MAQTSRLARESHRDHNPQRNHNRRPALSKVFFSSYLFELLLGAKLTGVSTLLLSAILSTGGKTGVALAADCLLTVESLREKSESWVVNTSTKTENKVESRFLLDVVVA